MQMPWEKKICLFKWWTESGGSRIELYGSVYFVLMVLAAVSMSGYLWAMFILITPRTARKFHYILLKTVMRAPQSLFSSTDSGTILNRFSQDMTMIEERLSTGFVLTVSSFFMSAASAALVAIGSSYMASTLPVLVLVIFLLQHVYLQTSRQLCLLDLEARSPLFSHFVETLSGLATIRAFGWEHTFNEQNHRLLDSSQRPYYLLSCTRRWLKLVLDLVVAAEAAIVVAQALSIRSSTSAGRLGVSMDNILTFSNNLALLIQGWTSLETSLGSIMRVRDFERDVKPEDKEGETYHEPPPEWPSQGMVEFRNVTASHDRTSNGIRDISLRILPGQKVGICGRTGSGKSSLVSALVRLLEIDSGAILVDGVDLTTIPRDTIRERLTVIPQDPLVLAGSLRSNIDFAGTHSDAAILAALERVGLAGKVGAGGLDDQITSTTLSKGQQQLLALARALLKRKPMEESNVRKKTVVVLDEATSSVDGQTDKVMQSVIRGEFAECTVLTVAHRIETIRASDVVVVMHEGWAAEVGSPEELLGRQGGMFVKLMNGVN